MLIFLFYIFLLIASAKQKVITRWCRSNVCLVGKTVIVTGSNTGIGYEAALDFAKRGGKVILACRDRTKAEKAKEKIIEETGNQNVFVEILDLSSLQSVRDFADRINEKFQQLDILVNNAGQASPSSQFTKDGLDLVMQVNYFGPVLLTHLLLDLLKKSGNSRIVNVSSINASFDEVDPQDLNKWDGHLQQYNKSKLCNILYTIKLARELSSTQVTTYSLHPGVVFTEIWRTVPSYVLPLFNFIAFYIFKDSLEGAQTILHCALQKGIEKYSGEHFDECKMVERYKTVKGVELIDEVWKETNRILNLDK